MSLNMYSEFKSEAEKEAAYKKDIQNPKTVFAQKADGTSIPLKYVSVSRVDRIGDLWRVQTPFSKPIRIVRKQEFVIGNKLPHIEHTKFDFYEAFSVGMNCYGRFVFPKPDYIVAEYRVANMVFDAYGKTIEDARAYLGIKLYDEFQDVIHESIKARGQHQK